jgi:hypothetical protein
LSFEDLTVEDVRQLKSSYIEQNSRLISDEEDIEEEFDKDRSILVVDDHDFNLIAVLGLLKQHRLYAD